MGEMTPTSPWRGVHESHRISPVDPNPTGSTNRTKPLPATQTRRGPSPIWGRVEFRTPLEGCKHNTPRELEDSTREAARSGQQSEARGGTPNLGASLADTGGEVCGTPSGPQPNHNPRR